MLRWMLREINTLYVRVNKGGGDFVRTATDRLADFLNDEHKTGSRERVLQQRVLRDLGPLIPPKEKAMTTDTIEFYLAHLQRKINRMNLRPHWVITPAEIALKGLRPGGGVCEIFGTRWVVSKRPFSSTTEGAVYLDVISALESGEFARLRRCGECRRFFVAVHGATAYCVPKCQKAHDRKAAVDRVRTWRADKAKEKAVEARQTAEQKGYKKFCRFWELINKKRRTGEEGHEIHPFLDDLGNGEVSRGWELVTQWQKKHATKEYTWDNLTKEQRGVFASTSIVMGSRGKPVV
jgi:hypothetical protein